MQRNAPAPRRGPWRRLWRGLLLTVAIAVALLVATVFALRFVPPPTTAFMLARTLDARAAGDRDFRVRWQWVPSARISAELAIAVVAAEDQKFPQHHGFDLDAIGEALEASGTGGRGASTISQQVAKNLFLWSGRSLVRKGMEAGLTVLIELLWPKPRILEMYVNVAEFGDGVYGAEAAAQAYFGKPAQRLSRREAALLAAVLPNPRTLRVDRPSAYVRERVRWIERQIAQLGGPDYLESSR